MPKEIKRVFLGSDVGKKCIFFDLSFGLYAPTIYSDWSLYSLPSTLIVLCQGDIEEPIETVFDEINRAIKPI